MLISASVCVCVVYFLFDIEGVCYHGGVVLLFVSFYFTTSGVKVGLVDFG